MGLHSQNPALSGFFLVFLGCFVYSRVHGSTNATYEKPLGEPPISPRAHRTASFFVHQLRRAAYASSHVRELRDVSQA